MAGWLDRMGHRRPVGHRGERRLLRPRVGRPRGAAERIFGEAGRPLALIGHSRGGHFAKALVYRRPISSRADLAWRRARHRVRHLDPILALVAACAGSTSRPPTASPATAASPTPAAAASPRTSPASSRPRCRSSRSTRAGTASRGGRPARLYARNVEATGSYIGLAYNRKANRVIGDPLVPEHAAGGGALRPVDRRVGPPCDPASPLARGCGRASAGRR